MWKWLNPEIALGLLVATVFWTGVLGWQAAYTPTERIKNECYEAAQKSGHKTEECKSLWERTTSDPVALFTFVLSVSTIGLWLVTWRSGVRQTRDMEGAIAAAEDANKLNRDQFAQTLRPWIRADIAIAGDFVCDGKHAYLELQIVLRNTGSSPAFGIHPFVTTYPNTIEGDLSETYEAISEMFRKQPIKEASFGLNLFPQDAPRTLDRTWSHASWHLTNIEIGKAKRPKSKAAGDTLGVCICVDYISVIRDRHYQTGYILMLMKRDGPGILRGVEWGEQHIPADQLVLASHPLGVRIS